MSDIWLQIKELIVHKEVSISVHGYEELADDDILARDAVNGAIDAILVEEYPNYHKGPCVLVLCTDRKNKPLHVLWGFQKNKGSLGTQGISIPERIVHNPKLEAHPSNYELRITNYANAPGNPKDPK